MVENLQKKLKEKNEKKLSETEAKLQELQSQINKLISENTEKDIQISSLNDKYEDHISTEREYKNQNKELEKINNDFKSQYERVMHQSEIQSEKIRSLQAQLDASDAQTELKLKEITSQIDAQYYRTKVQVDHELIKKDKDCQRKVELALREADSHKYQTKNWQNRCMESESTIAWYKALIALMLTGLIVVGIKFYN